MGDPAIQTGSKVADLHQLALYLREVGVVPPFFALAFPPGVRPDIRG